METARTTVDLQGPAAPVVYREPYVEPCCAGSTDYGVPGGLCFVPRDERTEVTWQAVGEKEGDYEAVTLYNYVGEKHGSYHREEVTRHYGCRVRPCCLGLLLCLLIAVIVFCLVYFLRPVSVVVVTTSAPALITIPSTTFREISTTTSLPYDCDEDYHDCYHCLRVRWSYAKRHWCCAHVGRGCSTTTTEVSFDCDAGYNNWVAGWSDEKKEWCCARTHRGCTTTPCPHAR